MSELVKVVRVSTPAQLEQAYLVRLEVFVREQQVPIEFEIDDLDTDPTTVHVLALRTDVFPHQPIGTARLLPDAANPGHLHIGRVAVLAHARKMSVGKELMAALEEIAVADHSYQGAVTIELSAQEQALEFYHRQGYELFDDRRYLDCDIWHRDARKVITRRPTV